VQSRDARKTLGQRHTPPVGERLIRVSRELLKHFGSILSATGSRATEALVPLSATWLALSGHSPFPERLMPRRKVLPASGALTSQQLSARTLGGRNYPHSRRYSAPPVLRTTIRDAVSDKEDANRIDEPSRAGRFRHKSRRCPRCVRRPFDRWPHGPKRCRGEIRRRTSRIRIARTASQSPPITTRTPSTGERAD
jgi:hypothetical protein